MKRTSKVSAVIDVVKIKIVANKFAVEEYEQQKGVDHPPSKTPRSRTIVVPAVPIMMCSMRLIRRMVSFHRSAQTASWVSSSALTDVTVGLLIILSGCLRMSRRMI